MVKDLVRLDIQASIITFINWCLLSAVILHLNSLLPVSYYYTVLLIGLSLMELLPRLSKATSMYQSLLWLLIYENTYTLLLVLIWLLTELSIETALIMLVTSKAFYLLGKNHSTKFYNVFNMYYGKRAVKISAKISVLETRAQFVGMLLGLFVSYLGLNAIVILFAIGQIISLHYGLKLLKVTKQVSLKY